MQELQNDPRNQLPKEPKKWNQPPKLNQPATTPQKNDHTSGSIGNLTAAPTQTPTATTKQNLTAPPPHQQPPKVPVRIQPWRLKSELTNLNAPPPPQRQQQQSEPQPERHVPEPQVIFHQPQTRKGGYDFYQNATNSAVVLEIEGEEDFEFIMKPIDLPETKLDENMLEMENDIEQHIAKMSAEGYRFADDQEKMHRKDRMRRAAAARAHAPRTRSNFDDEEKPARGKRGKFIDKQEVKDDPDDRRGSRVEFNMSVNSRPRGGGGM